MKPAPFEYVRARDFAHATELLADHRGEAKVLAGGQSLLPIMNLRLARPRALIDLGKIQEGRHILAEGGGLRLGALVRHAQVEHYPIDIAGFRWLPAVMGLIGHEPIRWRGTVGGSIAHADAAAEWCLLAVLLDARLVVLGPHGLRTVAAAEFFQGVMTTDLASDEVLMEIQFPQGRSHLAVNEMVRRAGDFAIASCAVACNLLSGRAADVCIAFGGLSTLPFRCPELEQAVEGQPASEVRAGALIEIVTREISRTVDSSALTEYLLGVASDTFHQALNGCFAGQVAS